MHPLRWIASAGATARREAAQAARITICAAVAWQLTLWLGASNPPVFAALVPIVALQGDPFAVIGLSLETARTAMLFGAARGVLSAAVRLGIIGSYEAQRMHHDAGRDLSPLLERCNALDADDVCQTAPVLDILHAGHDRLYSRLFQS